MRVLFSVLFYISAFNFALHANSLATQLFQSTDSGTITGLTSHDYDCDGKLDILYSQGNRIFWIKGTCCYQYGGIDAKTVLNLHMTDTNFTDSSGSQNSVTGYNGASIDSSIGSPLSDGGNVLSLDGTNDYIESLDNIDYEMGSGNFTIDLWVYPKDSRRANIMGAVNNSDMSFSIFQEYKKIEFHWSTNGTSSSKIASASDELSLNTWNHIACVRSGDVLIIYVNGREVANGALTGTLYNTSQPLVIGANSAYTSHFYGYIEELRISKGAIRFNENFEVPCEEYREP